ncbi:MAG: hypothetical protein ABIJ72_00070 [bacterium]
MFQKKTLIVGFIVVVLGLAFGTFFIRSNHKQDTNKVKASSNTATLTSQADWDGGSLVNIDSASTSGQIAINDKVAGSKLNLSNYSISTTQNDASKGNAFDNNTATYWQSNTGWASNCVDIGDSSYIVDLGSEWATIHLSKIKIMIDRQIHSYWLHAFISQSSDGINYSPAGTMEEVNPTGIWQELNIGQSRYIKVSLVSTTGMCDGSDYNPTYLYELELYTSGASAVHTTGNTQIDGGVNFWQWESSTPAQSTPANTSITYRYRTSTNGSDWTAWVANIGSVTSRTGDDSNNPTKYRYLQVEATLANTDGASAPAIDQYDIGYHTNQKPNKPTAQTAVIN